MLDFVRFWHNGAHKRVFYSRRPLRPQQSCVFSEDPLGQNSGFRVHPPRPHLGHVSHTQAIGAGCRSGGTLM